MYYLPMNTDDVGIRLDRIEEVMGREGLDNKDLAGLVGISPAAISKLLNKKSPGMSAVNIKRIAEALRVSMDYLLGLTDDPLPKSISEEKDILELARAAYRLPKSRRRDVLKMAQVWIESAEEDRHQALSDAEDIIFGLADRLGQGEELEQRLAEILRRWLSKGEDDENGDAGGGDDPA